MHFPHHFSSSHCFYAFFPKPSFHLFSLSSQFMIRVIYNPHQFVFTIYPSCLCCLNMFSFLCLYRIYKFTYPNVKPVLFALVCLFIGAKSHNLLHCNIYKQELATLTGKLCHRFGLRRLQKRFINSDPIFFGYCNNYIGGSS